MAFFMKAFHFVVCCLVIYSCFENKIAKIGAKDPALRENVNNAGGQERNIVFLSEKLSDVSSYDEQFKTKPETEDGAGKAGESYTIDDEDGERERRADSGSGDGMDVQGDEPAASSDGSDAKLDGPSPIIDSKLNSTSTRSPDSALTANFTTVATPALLLSSTTFNVTFFTWTLRESASRSVSSTPPLITTHASSDVQISMIEIDASVFTSMKKTSASASAMSTKDTRASSVLVSSSSSVTIIEPTSKQPKTVETTTKESNDVQNQKGPSPKVKEKKTLFGFVTIEILVALLAGAACAVILLVFLVYRLKKRNEGSYELQESLMMKSGGYSEEKEVFV